MEVKFLTLDVRDASDKDIEKKINEILSDIESNGGEIKNIQQTPVQNTGRVNVLIWHEKKKKLTG